MFYKSTWVICKLICHFYKPNIIPVSNKVKFNFISKWFIQLLICRIFKLFSVVDAEFAPTKHGILVARLPSKLWHIMIYLSPVVTAYGTSCIEQHTQCQTGCHHFRRKLSCQRFSTTNLPCSCTSFRCKFKHKNKAV